MTQIPEQYLLSVPAITFPHYFAELLSCKVEKKFFSKIGTKYKVCKSWYYMLTIYKAIFLESLYGTPSKLGTTNNEH